MLSAQAASIIPPREGIRVFVINLDRNRDRLASARRQCGSFERWPGVLISHRLELRAYMRFFRADFASERVEFGLGDFGCTLAHLTLLEHIRELDDEFVLVFEDDFLLIRPLEVLIAEIQRFPPNWDIINLGGWTLPTAESITETVSHANGHFTRSFGGTVGMFGLAIKVASCDRILALCYGTLHEQHRNADSVLNAISPSLFVYRLERGAFVDHEFGFSSERCSINVGGIRSRLIRKLRKLRRTVWPPEG